MIYCDLGDFSSGSLRNKVIDCARKGAPTNAAERKRKRDRVRGERMRRKRREERNRERERGRERKREIYLSRSLPGWIVNLRLLIRGKSYHAASRTETRLLRTSDKFA